MKNLQAPESRAKGDGLTLEVNSIFSTIQGEGPFAGRAATFIRLAGCNLQCPLCDTEYTIRSQWHVRSILETLLDHRTSLVVLTGGEPFRQPIAHLIRVLRSHEIVVQIETNGKLPADEDLLTGNIRRKGLWIVISPKTATIDPQLAMMADAYKYVVRRGDVADDGLPIRALDHPVPTGGYIARPPKGWHGDIFIQPCDEQDETKNEANMQAAVRSVMTHDDPRRRLCLQMHKIAGLP